MASLVHDGAEIYEVRILRSTLEDVYLEAVSDGGVEGSDA